VLHIQLATLHYIRAFATGSIVRKSLRKQVCSDKILELETENPVAWWRNIKSLVRFDKFKYSIDHLKYQSAEIPIDELPDIINEYFFSVTQHIPPLDHAVLANLGSPLGSLPVEFVVSEYEVFIQNY
jgi:hypothetical protein